MAVTGTSFKRAYVGPQLLPGLLYSVPLTPQPVAVNPRLHQRLIDAHQQFWLSPLWGHCSFLLGPGAHKVLLCPPRVCFPGGFQSFCRIPRFGNLFWVLELLQQCENFFGIIVLQVVCHLLGSTMVGLPAPSPRELTPHAGPPRPAAARVPVPVGGHC